MSIPGSASPLFLATAAAADAAAYQIDRSLRFNDDDQAYLSKNIGSVGDQRRMTFSFWIKRHSISSSAGFAIFAQDYLTSPSNHVIDRSLSMLFESDRLELYDYGASDDSGNNGSVQPWPGGIVREGSQNVLFRDPSAWYSVIFAIDTTQSTAANRCKVWINGVQRTMSGYPVQNSYLSWGQAKNHYIGIQKTNGSFTRAGDFSLADVHFIDGQQLSNTDFGEFDNNGVWQPKEVSGVTYGTNGFHLKFANNSSTSNLGTDSSGNSNTWAVNNFSVASGAGNDSLSDTPTDYTADSGNNGGNYATLNSISPVGRDCTFSNGNLDVVVGDGFGSTSNDGIRAVSTIGMTSGKWYFEHKITGGSVARSNVGVVNDIATYGYNDNHWVGRGPGDYIVWSHNGAAYNNASESSYGVSWTTGDIIGCAFDADNGNLYVYKNGTVMNSGTAAHTGLTNGPYFFVCTERLSNISANFGQRPFEYTPPTGYVSLCTQNLSESAYASIPDSSKAFDIATFTGNGTTNTAITGLNHSPDLLWIKSRSSTQWHFLADTVRGNTKNLASNATDAEETRTNRLLSFDSNGFTIGNNNTVNENNSNFVAWAWDAGTSAASSNTDGSITSSVRANASAGISIVSWTGRNGTVGHGLNDKLGLILTKIRNSSSIWPVQHSAIGTNILQLESTAASASDSSNRFNATEPTNSVFTAGTWWNSDSQGIAYCFAPVEGFSAFGSFNSLNSTDNVFVYTGFRPRWILWKRSSSSGGWFIYDAKRDPVNSVDSYLPVDTNGQEDVASPAPLDFLSNGFKVRNTLGGTGTFIYAAFAEHPFKTARAR